MELLWYCDIIKHVIYCNIKSLKYHINSNITAADGTLFRFGKNADGQFGYIITDEAGADSVVPFKSDTKIINLGTGTSFNVSTQKGYQKFTHNNFFVIPESFGSFSIADTQMGGGSANTTSISLPINKSYNAQTGQFTCSAQLNLSFYVRYSNGSGGSFGKNASVTCRVYLAY